MKVLFNIIKFVLLLYIAFERSFATSSISESFYQISDLPLAGEAFATTDLHLDRDRVLDYPHKTLLEYAIKALEITETSPK